MSCVYQYKAKQLVFSAAILWAFAFHGVDAKNSVRTGGRGATPCQGKISQVPARPLIWQTPQGVDKEIGVPNETVSIPDPQDIPKSWEISVSASGTNLSLVSSNPFIDFAR